MDFEDERIKMIVDIDSKITERKIFGHIGVSPNVKHKPVLFIRGMRQYQENVGDQLEKVQNATIWAPNVDHSAFSDDAYFTNKIPDFGRQGVFADAFTWFFKKGPYFSNVDTNLGEYEVETWFTDYRKTIVEWLNLKLSEGLHDKDKLSKHENN